MEIQTREFRLPFPLGFHSGRFAEGHGYLECHVNALGFPSLHMPGDRLLCDDNGIGQEGSWTRFLGSVLGRTFSQDKVWKNVLALNPRAERKGTILKKTDAAVLTSEGKIYLNDWSHRGVTRHWLLKEGDNHDFKALFEWRSVPELDDGTSTPTGFTFGVKRNGLPVLVEVRSEEELEEISYADIAENILSLIRIQKVEEDRAQLFILHTGGEVSAFCFSQEVLGELVHWKGIADIRILTGCVAGLTRDGRTLIAPKRLEESYYDGFRKLKEIPFEHLRQLWTGLHPPIADWVDFRKAVQLDYLVFGGSYRALMDDGTIVVALFSPGIAARITPPFPVDRLIFFEEDDFVAQSKDHRAAVVSWGYDHRADRHVLHFIEPPKKASPCEVIVDHSGNIGHVTFLTRDGTLYRWDDIRQRFSILRKGLLACGSNGASTADAYFGTLTGEGRLELKTFHQKIFAPCQVDGVEEVVFAKHHVLFRKADGTVGFLGKPRPCCSGLDAYRDVVSIEGTDSTTTLRLADGASVLISAGKVVRTPPSGS